MNSAEKVRSDSNLEKRIKRQVIGKPHRFEAVAPLGFENTLVEELNYIGIECCSATTANSADSASAIGIKVAGDGKVEFTAKITEAWKAVAYSRIANRVLMEIGAFKAENFGQLEKHAAEIPWELYLDERTALGAAKSRNLDIHVTCKHSRLYHSDAVEERIRKVLLNHMVPETADSQSKVVDVNEELVESLAEATQHLYVRLLDDRCTLWLDLAGEELYKRGHERFVAEAPLKETIAAAMIFEATKLTTNHQPLTTILDGMAGSGTFSLEAAYIANGLIPGKCRDFALKHQPAFKEGTWNFILKGVPNNNASEATQSKQAIPAIITSDISERPVDIIRHNVEVSPLPASAIDPQLKDFFSYTAADIPQGSIILLNPPYGKRLDCDAPNLYSKIGRKLSEFKGSVVAILAPKDDSRNGLQYTCTKNLLQACPSLDPRKNSGVKIIETSHGGFSLNAIFAKI